MLRLAAERDVAVVVAAVFNSGLLSREHVPDDAHFDYGQAPARGPRPRARHRADLPRARRLAARRGRAVPAAAPAGRVGGRRHARGRAGTRDSRSASPHRLPDELWRALADAGHIRMPRPHEHDHRRRGPRPALSDIRHRRRLRCDESGCRLLGRLRRADDGRVTRRGDTAARAWLHVHDRPRQRAVRRGGAHLRGPAGRPGSRRCGRRPRRHLPAARLGLAAALARPGEGRRAPRDGRGHERGVGSRRAAGGQAAVALPRRAARRDPRRHAGSALPLGRADPRRGDRDAPRERAAARGADRRARGRRRLPVLHDERGLARLRRRQDGAAAARGDRRGLHARQAQGRPRPRRGSPSRGPRTRDDRPGHQAHDRCEPDVGRARGDRVGGRAGRVRPALDRGADEPRRRARATRRSARRSRRSASRPASTA